MVSYLNFSLVAGFLSLVANALQPEGLHFPLFRSGIDLDTLSGASKQHYNIASRVHDVPHRMSKRALPGQPIPFRYSEYRVPLIDILVGNPPQNVTVLLDTGSPWTWARSVGNNLFNRAASRTWHQGPNPRNDTYRYLDGHSCNVTIGKDFVSVGTFTVDLSLGSELGNSSLEKGMFGLNSSLEFGILGLSPDSDFAAEILKVNYTDNIFSFAFKDEHTGEGEDLFEVCGYAGLDLKEIIWLGSSTQYPELYNKHLYTLDFWYAATARTTRSPTSGNPVTAIVDTGSSTVLMTDEVWGTIFNDTPRFIKKPFKPECEAQARGVQMPLVNLTGLEPYENPSFVMKLDRLEWVMEIGNPHIQERVEQVCDLGGEQGLVGPALLSQSDLKLKLGETIIIGQTFWGGLKGMVFEFTPGKERVGFVPRNRWKNGLLNPVFTPLDKDLEAGKSREKSKGSRSLRVSLSVIALCLSISLAVSIFL